MNWWQRIVREPALVLGVVTAAFGVLVLFGVELSDVQIGAVVTFLGAVFALLRYVLTPTSEVVVQQKPGDQAVTAAAVPDTVPGTPVRGLAVSDRVVDLN